MNRHQRRRHEAARRTIEAAERKAAEAETRGEQGMGSTTDKGFEQYRDLYRRAYKKTSEREIGEGWMRGEAAAASGAEQMMIHPVGEGPSAPRDDDIFLSASYGPQRFVGRAARRHLQMLIDVWPDFVRQVRNAGISTKGLITDDPRHDAREFIFEMVLENRAQSDGMMAALTASAIAWLAATSPAGVALGDSHRVAHYSITDQMELAAGGRKARNFRLALMNDPSQYAQLTQNMPPLPKW